jgi:acylphosphatase
VVRNLDDGRVEVAAEGESESMIRFERALRQGPSRARVEQVIVEDTEPLMRSDFVIED